MNEQRAKLIADFVPVNGNWLPLEVLLQEVFSERDPSKYYPAIFCLFERFPNDDGAGVFWSALHGMEHHDNYDVPLLSSYFRSPSAMTKIMLMRILNSGQSEIGDYSIEQLLGNKSSAVLR